MYKPKEKYWTVTEAEVGREVGNPDYIQWADEKIASLESAIRIFFSTTTNLVKQLDEKEKT